MDLTDAWDAAVGILGGRAAGGSFLEDAYGSADRSYHDSAHIRQVLRDSADLAADLPDRQRAHVALAALAHDVVYRGIPVEDERESAETARRMLLSQGVPSADADEVARLVLATIDHVAAHDDPAGIAVMDADLAVLGGDDAAYDGYVAKVRREYAAFDDDTWALGRSAVLEELLSHEHLYQSVQARARWEERARANLRRELVSYRR